MKSAFPPDFFKPTGDLNEDELKGETNLLMMPDLHFLNESNMNHPNHNFRNNVQANLSNPIFDTITIDSQNNNLKLANRNGKRYSKLPKEEYGVKLPQLTRKESMASNKIVSKVPLNYHFDSK